MPRTASLSLDLLSTFVKLIENDGDATKTAEDLDINQPSMSKRLRYLQCKSPVLKRGPWLVREGKTWMLTEAGRQALPAVRELIGRYEQLVEFANAETTDLHFACGRHAVLSFVKEALKQFRREHPDARLRAATLRGEDRVAGVANGSLDLAIVDYDTDLIHEIARRKLYVKEVGMHRLGLICSKRSRWAAKLETLAKTKADIQAFTRFPLILPEPDAGIRRVLDVVFRQHNLQGKLDVRLEIGGWGTILAYVKEGFGVGLISESAVPASRDLVVRYFDPATMPPSNTKIICRYQFDSDQPELTEVGEAFCRALRDAASCNPSVGRRVKKTS
jgi:DNA-binding transcriptional LysR family regulator